MKAAATRLAPSVHPMASRTLSRSRSGGQAAGGQSGPGAGGLNPAGHLGLVPAKRAFMVPVTSLRVVGRLLMSSCLSIATAAATIRLRTSDALGYEASCRF